MIPHSRLFEDAVHYSHTLLTRVDIYVGSTLVYPDVKVTGGSVSCDAGSLIRWNADIDLALSPWETLPLLTNEAARFKVYRGITSLGRTEVLQLGEYRVVDADRSERGTVKVEGEGLEGYIADARFERPRVPPYGASTTQAIIDLIDEALPFAVSVIPRTTTNRRVAATAPWKRDRDEAIESLADSINAVVYANNEGVFVIDDVPSINSVPVFTVAAGEGGVMLGAQKAQKRGFNAVSVSSSSSNSDTVPFYGFAGDDDPASPTYYNGLYGKKPKFYSSQFFTNDAQCVETAQEMLVKELARTQPIAFSALPAIFLEAGDMIQIVLPDGTVQSNLLETIKYGLEPGGQVAAQTYVAPEATES